MALHKLRVVVDNLPTFLCLILPCMAPASDVVPDQLIIFMSGTRAISGQRSIQTPECVRRVQMAGMAWSIQHSLFKGVLLGVKCRQAIHLQASKYLCSLRT